MGALLLPEIKAYVNRSLPSDEFLKELLPEDDSWEVDEDSIKLAMQAASNLHARGKEQWARSSQTRLDGELAPGVDVLRRGNEGRECEARERVAVD